MKRKIVILGSTGSIGENALRVVRALPDELSVVGLAACSNVERLVEQAAAFGVKTIAVTDETRVAEAEALARPQGITVLSGPRALEEISVLPEADTVLCSVVGLAGLPPVLAAIDAGKDIALATKEVLVSAGSLVMARRAEKGVRILPVDSEHSAIFQALQSGEWQAACVRSPDAAPSAFAERRIDRLILTASGGPFAARPEVDFETVTPETALRHPNWRMGPKVTIDSATMMNKGLEIMEASALFGIPDSRIEVLVHPQSVVHTLVRYVDGNQIAQLSGADMRFPIQYALTWPERRDVAMPQLDLAEIGALTFARPDESRFRCLALAHAAMRTGGTAPAALNAADEVAVAAFLQERIRFSDIPRIIEEVLACQDVKPCTTFERVYESDAWARREAERMVAAQ